MMDHEPIDEQENAVRSLLRSRTPRPSIFGRIVRFIFFGILGIVGLVVLLAFLGSDSDVDLRVVLRDGLDRGDRNALFVTNVGKHPVTITDIVVNDRKDCSVVTLPKTLQIGDEGLFASSCKVVRITVVTDGGQESFSF